MFLLKKAISPLIKPPVSSNSLCVMPMTVVYGKDADYYVQQFKDPKLEKLVSLLVLDKFFKKSNQNKQSN